MATVELTHLARAPVEEVFRALIEPERLALWLAPSSAFRAVRCEARGEPGGALAAEFAGPGGGALSLRGAYRVVEPPRRVALDWRAALGELDSGDGELEVVLAPCDGGTRVTLRHSGLAPEHAEVARGAWRAALGRLPAALLEALERFYGRFAGPPGRRSRFGGLWTDAPDWEARLAERRARGELTSRDAGRLAHFAEKGYAVLEGAADGAAVDRLRAEVDRAFAQGRAGLWCEVFDGERPRQAPIAPGLRDVPHKVLDLHGHSQAARDVACAPELVRFLGQLFERPPLAFQSLWFTRGTEQDMHQDTAFVLVRSPLEFVGTWVALEDVQPGAGELQYYEGSHRIDEYLWLGRGRALPPGYEDQAEFLAWMHEGPRRLGLPLRRFAPKKGDALVWHADLVHGGAPIERPGSTRRSLVTHFCPLDVDPEWLDAAPGAPKLADRSGAHYTSQVRG